MRSKRLTNTIRESIVKQAVQDLFKDSLLKEWKTVEARFTDLVKDSFKDFDWEHVGPYRRFMYWHSAVWLSNVPGEWNLCWDDFRKVYGLPSVNRIEIAFEYPSRQDGAVYLDSAYQKQAEDILRPYMIQYFTARKYFEDIRQVLLGLNTFKQLEDTVPELIKYLPAAGIGAITALVPIEQIDRVRSVLRKEAV